MNIKKEERPGGGRYFARFGQSEAELTFSNHAAGRVSVDHIEVPEAMRGQRIGQILADFAVEEARRFGWTLVPVCPFFTRLAGRREDWNDVVER